MPKLELYTKNVFVRFFCGFFVVFLLVFACFCIASFFPNEEIPLNFLILAYYVINAWMEYFLLQSICSLFFSSLLVATPFIFLSYVLCPPFNLFPSAAPFSRTPSLFLSLTILLGTRFLSPAVIFGFTASPAALCLTYSASGSGNDGYIATPALHRGHAFVRTCTGVYITPITTSPVLPLR